MVTNPLGYTHFMPVPKVAGRKVLVYELFTGMTLTSKGDATNWSYTKVDAEELLYLGPYLTSIQAHTNTTGATSAHSWKVVFWWSFDGRNWLPTNPENLFTAITGGSGAAIQAAYTSTGNFGYMMKYAAGVKNNAGATIETASVSCKLVFTFAS